VTTFFMASAAPGGPKPPTAPPSGPASNASVRVVTSQRDSRFIMK